MQSFSIYKAELWLYGSGCERLEATSAQVELPLPLHLMTGLRLRLIPAAGCLDELGFVRRRRVRIVPPKVDEEDRREKKATSLEPNDAKKARNATDSVENKMDDVTAMVAGVLSDDPTSQLESTTKLRKFLSLDITSNVDNVIQSEVVPRLVEFLEKEDYPELQLEATAIISNIASAEPEVVIERGAIPILVKLLVSPNDDISEESMVALGYVADVSPANRDLVLNFGALKNLLSKMLLVIKPFTRRVGFRTLLSICRCPPQGPIPLFEQVKEALILVEMYLKLDLDEELLSDVCWTLWYMCYGSDEGIQRVIEHRSVPNLVQLLQHTSPRVLTPVCCIICPILGIDKKQIQLVIDGGALPILANLLTQEYEKTIKMEACSMIRYITAGTEDQIQSVIDADLIPILVNLAQNAEMDIKMKAIRAISNATSGGSDAQVKYLVKNSCIKPLCDLLVCEDLRVVLSCLNGLEKITKLGVEKETGDYAEGLAKIDNLRTHVDEQIKYKAAKILKENWFDVTAMVAGVVSDDPTSQLESTTKLRKFLSLDITSNVDNVIQSEVVPRLVEFLEKEDYPELQLEATAIISNIASAAPEVVIERGAIPILVKLLVSCNNDISEESMVALGYVADVSPENRDLVLNLGALKNLLIKMYTPNKRTSTIKVGFRTLLSICRCPPQGPIPLFEQVKEALYLVIRFLPPSDLPLRLDLDEDLLSNACWTLWCMCYGSDEGIRSLIKLDCSVRQLVQLLQHTSPRVLTPVCCIICPILDIDKKQIQLVIDGGALPILANFLTQEYDKTIKTEACSMIRYITAGTEDQIQSVIAADLIPILVSLAQNAEMDIKMKAIRAISNATSGGSDAQVKYLVKNSCIKPLCDLLVCEDLRVVLSCLNGLERIMKLGVEKDTGYYHQLIRDAEGLAKMDNLRTHVDEQIKDKAAKILKENWLDGEDVEDVEGWLRRMRKMWKRKTKIEETTTSKDMI